MTQKQRRGEDVRQKEPKLEDMRDRNKKQDNEMRRWDSEMEGDEEVI